MHAGTDIDAERARRVPQRDRVANGSHRPVEGREEPIASTLELSAAVAGQLELVSALGKHGGADDLARDERDQLAMVLLRALGGAALGKERLDDVEDLIGVDADEVVGSRQLDEAGAGDALGDVAALFDSTS